MCGGGPTLLQQRQALVRVGSLAGKCDTQGRKAGASPAALGRAGRNKLYRLAVLVASLLSALGFAPSYARALAGEGWYLDAVSKINVQHVAAAAARLGATWGVLMNVHALTTAGWLVGIAHQALTGAAGSPGGAEKGLHRLAGWVLVPLGAAVIVEALLLEFMKGLSTLSGPILMVGLMMGVNLTVGVRHAVKRQILLHKAAMTWASVWSCMPGIVRIFIYMYRATPVCPGSIMPFSTGILCCVASTCLLIPGAVLLGDGRTAIFAANVAGVAMVFAGDIGGTILQYRWAATLCLE